MIKPNKLKRGDKVAIVSLSRGMLGEKMFIHKYEIAKKRLEDLYGLEVIAMPNALKGIDYLYNHPEARAEDFMSAFKDKEIKAIFNAIGGDDGIRLLPFIDFDVIRNNPKIFTGFSDTTTHHFMCHKAGIVSYYGLSVMNNLAEYVEINEYTKEFIDKMFFNPEQNLEVKASKFCSYDEDKIWWGEEHINEKTPRFENSGYELIQGKGTITGELFGGCVDVFIELIGTPLWPSLDDFKDKILLLETSESNMSEDTLTWILRNLQAQGIFDVIKGIVVGKPAFKDKLETYKDVYKRVVGFESNHPEMPILYNVNIGHAYPTCILGLGLKYEINSENKSLTLIEKATLN